MNRAERRRLERASTKKEPVVNIKSSVIQEIKRNATNEATDRVFLLMFALPMMVLRDQWGFGKVRGERFINQVLDLYRAFEQGYVTLEDLHTCLWEEGGIKIERVWGVGNNKNPFNNASGCADPTAYYALKPIIKSEAELDRKSHNLIMVLKSVVEFAGFEFIGRIQIRDKKTGKEFR